jgi:hypothetical protein
MTKAVKTGRWEGFAVLTLGVLAAAACDKKDETAPIAPAASSVAPSVAPPTAMVVKYVLEPTGKTAIDMPAPNEHIKADTSVSAGQLQVDLMNLTNSRGEVKVDLQTLKTTTFGEAEKDTKQTEHALTWLEVGDKAPPADRETNRWATYAIRSVDGLSAPDITKVAAEKGADGEVRTVQLTAHGEFLLHGHKVDKTAPLEIHFHYPPGAPPDSKPASIDVTTKAPLHVVLAEHDVKPRDNLGKLASGALGLLGTKVAETADVTFDLHAKVAP